MKYFLVVFAIFFSVELYASDAVIQDGYYRTHSDSDRCDVRIINDFYENRIVVAEPTLKNSDRLCEKRGTGIAKRVDANTFYQVTGSLDITAEVVKVCARNKDGSYPCKPKEVFYDKSGKILLREGDRSEWGIYLKILNSEIFLVVAVSRVIRNEKIIIEKRWEDTPLLYQKMPGNWEEK